MNVFLDGTIEKEIYLAKKDELIKTKTDLQQRKSYLGRNGNNWLEPLRNWIKTAYYAKKIALMEKIGTNRRLLDKKVIFNFQNV